MVAHDKPVQVAGLLQSGAHFRALATHERHTEPPRGQQLKAGMIAVVAASRCGGNPYALRPRKDAVLERHAYGPLPR